MIKKLVFTILLALVSSSTSHARLFIEPYASYGMSKGDVKFEDTDQGNNTADNEWKGLAYGAKAGFSIMMISLGADYMHVDMENNFTNTVNNVKGTTDITGGNVGAYLSLNLPSFNINASYFPKYEVRSQADLGHDIIKGKAFKAGISFELTHFIALNFDYMSIKSEESDWFANNGPSGTMDTFLEKNSLILVGLSFPLSF